MNFFFLILCVVALNVNAIPAITEQYERLPSGSLCAESVLITTLSDCKSAAAALNLNKWGDSGSWQSLNDFSGCQITRGNVLFNTAQDYKGSNAPLADWNAICRKAKPCTGEIKACLDDKKTDPCVCLANYKNANGPWEDCASLDGMLNPLYDEHCEDAEADRVQRNKEAEEKENAVAKPCTGEINACLDDKTTDPCVCLANYKDANGPWEDCAISGGMLNTLYNQQCEDAEADRVQRNKEAEEKENAETCEDVEPPVYFTNNSCAKQKANGKCVIRIRKDSMYCRKTCGLCGDEPKEHVPDCYDLPPPAWFKNNTCELQLSAGKCPKRNAEDSKYCRKTCGTCGVLA